MDRERAVDYARERAGHLRGVKENESGETPLLGVPIAGNLSQVLSDLLQ